MAYREDARFGKSNSSVVARVQSINQRNVAKKLANRRERGTAASDVPAPRHMSKKLRNSGQRPGSRRQISQAHLSFSRDPGAMVGVNPRKDSDLREATDMQASGQANETFGFRSGQAGFQDDQLSSLEPSDEGSGSAPTKILHTFIDPFEPFATNVENLISNDQGASWADVEINQEEILLGTGSFIVSDMVHGAAHSAEDVYSNLVSLQEHEAKDKRYQPGDSLILWMTMPLRYDGLVARIHERTDTTDPAIDLVNSWLLTLLLATRVQNLVFGTRLYVCLRWYGIEPRLLSVARLTQQAQNCWYVTVPENLPFAHPQHPDQPPKIPPQAKDTNSIMDDIRDKNPVYTVLPDDFFVCTKSNAAGFYVPGRIFSTITYEQPPWSGTSDSKILTKTKEAPRRIFLHESGEIVASYVRHYVVVEPGKGCCLVVPVKSGGLSAIRSPSRQLESGQGQTKRTRATATTKPFPTFPVYAYFNAEALWLDGSQLEVRKPQSLRTDLPTKSLGRIRDVRGLPILVGWLQRRLEPGYDGKKDVFVLKNALERGVIAFPGGSSNESKPSPKPRRPQLLSWA